MEAPTTQRLQSSTDGGRRSSTMTDLARLRWHRSPIAIAALVVALAFFPTLTLAQDAEETLGEEDLPRASLVGEGGYAYQGEADIDGGGKLSVNRFDVGALGRMSLLQGLRWENAYFFSVNDYDFDGGGFSAGDPWETILTLRLVTRLRYQLSERWGVFGGGVFMLSPETGADWGDSFSGGGLAGVDFRASETLFVSLGAAVISQIEDNVQVAPSVILNWRPSERWTVRVGGVPASGGAAAGGEVAYRVIEPVEIGLGALFNQRRFRLDDSGPAPDGVGEDTTVPVRLRVGWYITPQIALHIVGGVALAGQVKLEDRSGDRLAKEDYDPAPYVGIRLAGGF